MCLGLHYCMSYAIIQYLLSWQYPMLISIQFLFDTKHSPRPGSSFAFHVTVISLSSQQDAGTDCLCFQNIEWCCSYLLHMSHILMNLSIENHVCKHWWDWSCWKVSWKGNLQPFTLPENAAECRENDHGVRPTFPGYHVFVKSVTTTSIPHHPRPVHAFTFTLTEIKKKTAAFNRLNA